MKLSLTIPCYNEEINIRRGVLDVVGKYAQNNHIITEVLIVDDGSQDDSKRLIKNKYLKKYSKLRLIENTHQGKPFAVITGIRESRGTHVVFSDCDLATPIGELKHLVKEAENGSQIVIGSRNRNREGAPLIRKIMAIGYIVLRDALIDLGGITDTQCGFKLFERKASRSIIEKLTVFKKPRRIKTASVGAGFDLEFLYVAKKHHYRIKEVPVKWVHKKTIRVGLLNDSFEAIRDLIRIKASDLQGAYD